MSRWALNDLVRNHPRRTHTMLQALVFVSCAFLVLFLSAKAAALLEDPDDHSFNSKIVVRGTVAHVAVVLLVVLLLAYVVALATAPVRLLPPAAEERRPIVEATQF